MTEPTSKPADKTKPEEPSAAKQKEPSAAKQKEPSAAKQKEPSAAKQKEPSAAKQKKPSGAGQEQSSTSGRQQPSRAELNGPASELEKSSDAEQPTAATTKQTDPIIVTNRQSGGKGLSIFAILLSLAAIGATGFTWYQAQVERVAANSSLAVGVTEIGGSVSRLGDSITRLQSQQDNVVTQDQLSTRLLQATQSTNDKLRQLADQQTALVSSIEKINADLQKGSNEFVIDEVSQLLKLANNSALFSRDANAAINALTLADIQLKELADPRFAIVRRKINEEIAMLNNIEQVDIESISVQLNSMAAKIPSLPLENEPPSGVEVVIDTVPATEEVTWRTELRRMWSDIVNSVQIQRVDQPPKPLLAPQQRYFLDQNIQLNLAKAELGVLQNRKVIFHQSIDTAKQWLQEYFDLQNPEVQTTLDQLEAVRNLPVGIELPPVAGSYDTLQSIKGGLQ